MSRKSETSRWKGNFERLAQTTNKTSEERGKMTGYRRRRRKKKRNDGACLDENFIIIKRLFLFFDLKMVG